MDTKREISDAQSFERYGRWYHTITTAERRDLIDIIFHYKIRLLNNGCAGSKFVFVSRQCCDTLNYQEEENT